MGKEILLKDCCRKQNCNFLDGRGQDIPDIDADALNVRIHIESAVAAAFFSSGERKEEAIKEVGGMLASHCFFVRELTSGAISKITGFGKDNHKIPTS